LFQAFLALGIEPIFELLVLGEFAVWLDGVAVPAILGICFIFLLLFIGSILYVI